MVMLCMPDDLLSVIEKKPPKQDQTTIHVHSVQCGEHGTSRCSKQAACRKYMYMYLVRECENLEEGHSKIKNSRGPPLPPHVLMLPN